MENIPDPIRTISQIETDLNSQNNGTWVRVPNYYGLVTPEISGNNLNFLVGKQGILLVAFMNVTTTEVKIFVAKYLDIPERNQLF